MKKLATALFLVFLAVGFSGCSLQENPAERVLVEPVQYATSAMDEIREVDYLVYFAILEKSAGTRINVVRKIQSARLGAMTDEIKEKFAGLGPSVIENFNAKSDKAVFLAPVNPMERNVTFFDESEPKSPAKSARDLEKQFEHYPYYRFSRIGFSDDGREALVMPIICVASVATEVTTGCGTSMGNGKSSIKSKHGSRSRAGLAKASGSVKNGGN